MKKFCMILILIAGGFCWAASSDEFIVKKKKKGPSTAMLKEECCRASGDLMAAIPGVLTTIADVQTLCLDTVCGMLEGDKESFCERASKQELTACLATLEKMHTHIVSMQNELARTTERLRAQIIKK